VCEQFKKLADFFFEMLTAGDFKGTANLERLVKVA
jgi:hypothetical protein